MTPKTTRRKFFKGQKFGRTTDGSENDLRALGSSSISSSKAISDGTSLEDTMSPRSKRKVCWSLFIPYHEPAILWVSAMKRRSMRESKTGSAAHFQFDCSGCFSQS